MHNTRTRQEVIDSLTKYELLTANRKLNNARPPLTAADIKCPDCGEEFPALFMVHHELWLSVAHANPKAILCMPCFEERLGRMLMLSDLLDVQVNKSYRAWGTR